MRNLMRVTLMTFVFATALTSCTKENLAEDHPLTETAATEIETMATEGSEGEPEDKREDPNQ